MPPPTPEQLQAFEPIKWATPFFDNANWTINQRARGFPKSSDSDRYCETTLRRDEGAQAWLELYQKPALGSNLVTRSISLFKYGHDFMGFTTICHGGAVMSMLDEALAFCMVANMTEESGRPLDKWGAIDGVDYDALIKKGELDLSTIKGYFVTAYLNTKFLKPVQCPGVVGIEVTLVEHKGHKLKVKGVMKDGNGTPLVEADGMWVRLGGGAKL